MRKKIYYLLSAFIVYLILGVIVDYLLDSHIDWVFIFFWTIFMTLADFFIIRNLKKWLSKKQN